MAGRTHTSPEASLPRCPAPACGRDLPLASLTYYRPLVPENGCEVRLHDTTLYNSLFRYDDNLLVNLHIFGQPASANPVFHLRRADASGWFDSYTESFEAVWASARPWEPDQEGGACDGKN